LFSLADCAPKFIEYGIHNTSPRLRKIIERFFTTIPPI
jgi:hypothetical protein